MTVTYDPIEQKKNHLDLLAIGYFILGGFCLLIPLFALLYLGLGTFMVVAPDEFNGDAPPAAVGCFVMAIGGFLILLGMAYALLMIWTGLNLRRRQRRMFCLVMAGISALNMPFGTILGVFTMVLLTQPDVQALFENGPPEVESGGASLPPGDPPPDGV
ncbi:MAG: hypothetical protein AAF481_07970 [Acidobacteriota bacterium]